MSAPSRAVHKPAFRTQAGAILPLELLLILAWVLCPPLAFAGLVLEAVHARTGSGTWRTVQAGVLLVLLFFAVAGLLVIAGPPV